MRKVIYLAAASAALSGCATPLTTYTPAAGQAVEFNQGVGSVTVQTTDALLIMYPTFRYQSPGDIPTFTLMVQNVSNHDIDFDPAALTATLDAQACPIYSLEERVMEVRRAAVRKKVALAVVGGLTAAAAGYAASHQTVNYSSVSYVGHRSYYTSGSIQMYDPASGIFAGAAVGAATGVGIHQIDKAAGYQEQAAQGIFQRTTIHPGTTAVGQIELKTPSSRFAMVNLDVPVNGFPTEMRFRKRTRFRFWFSAPFFSGDEDRESTSSRSTSEADCESGHRSGVGALRVNAGRPYWFNAATRDRVLRNSS